jgi:sarcosine oxidase
MAPAHVAVLGLGITGSSIAAALAARGFRVTAIEQFQDPLHERGSSHGDTRIYRRIPHEGEPYVELAAQSWDAWHDWSCLAGEELMVTTGGIDAGPAGCGYVNESLRLCEKYAPQQVRRLHQTFTGAEFNSLYPHFNLPADWQCVYQSTSGIVRPDATRSFLHRLARENGATTLHGAQVTGIDRLTHGVRVHTRSGPIECDKLVVAAGSWLPKLLPELPLSLTIERRVTGWFKPLTPQPLADGRFPIFILDAEGVWYGVPTPDGQIKLGNHSHFNQRIDPSETRRPVDEKDEAKVQEGLRRYLRGFSDQPVAFKSCIYTLNQGNRFVIDWHSQCEDILIFSCCSGHGFKYAPAYGAIAADLLEDKLRPDIAPFAMNEVAGSR